MAFGLDSLVRRIEWLEVNLRRLREHLADLADQIGQVRLRDPDREGRDRVGEIVVVRPLEAIGVASFTEAIPADPLATPPVPYTPARIVPATGNAIVWQDWDVGTGELRARRYVRRWSPEPEPGGTYTDTDAVVVVDNVNDDEGIPATAKYVICVRRPGGRLVAMTWHCGA